MYPYDLFWGIDLYTICLCLAIMAAMAVYRICADKQKVPAKLQNLCIVDAAVSIVIGYLSAVFFQALYNIGEYGEFRIDSETGATFYGGLIGGAACFLLIYFLAGGRIFRDKKEHVTFFFTILDIAAAAIAIAHSLGRIGCLMAGCCHGAVTDKWYGIYMVYLGQKVVPIQLYESLFLLALFALFLYRIWHGKTYNLCLYMALYGIWRFVIEYARDDYRGYTFISFLTPSQLTAILMVAGAAVLFSFERRILVRRHEKEKS